MARNFNIIFKNEGFIKVTASNVHCKLHAVKSRSARWSRCYYRIRWPCVTFKVIHLLQTFSIMIFRAAVQQLTRFQLTQRVARSLYGSGASCYRSALLSCNSRVSLSVGPPYGTICLDPGLKTTCHWTWRTNSRVAVVSDILAPLCRCSDWLTCLLNCRVKIHTEADLGVNKGNSHPVIIQQSVAHVTKLVQRLQNNTQSNTNCDVTFCDS